MENNQFTRIGTFCEKCREVICKCYEYEQDINKALNGFNDGLHPSSGIGGEKSVFEEMAEEILSQPKQWYIQLREETREVTEEEFNEAGVIEFFNHSSCKIHYEDNKQTLILD